MGQFASGFPTASRNHKYPSSAAVTRETCRYCATRRAILRSLSKWQSAQDPLALRKKWMQSYHWPGNVRELQNLTAFLATEYALKTEITAAILGEYVHPPKTGLSTPAATKPRHQDLTNENVISAVQSANGNLTKAATALGYKDSKSIKNFIEANGDKSFKRAMEEAGYPRPPGRPRILETDQAIFRSLI